MPIKTRGYGGSKVMNFDIVGSKDITQINYIINTEIMTKDITKTKQDVIIRNKTDTLIDTKVKNDIFTRVNENVNQNVNTNVFTSKFPFIIPGGGGGGRGFGWSRGTGRVRGKYTPSLIATTFGITGKQPSVITGFDIRPIPGSPSKKSKKFNMKNMVGF